MARTVDIQNSCIRRAATQLACLAWLCGVCATASIAQPVPPVRVLYPAQQGAARQTWGVAQAPDGTMGFANQAGLLLFDGTRWVLHQSPNGETLRSVAYDTLSESWLAGGYDAWYRWAHRGLVAGAVDPEVIRPPAGPREEWWHVIPDPGAPGEFLWQTFSRAARLPIDGGPAQAIDVPGNITFAEVIDGRVVLPTIRGDLFGRSADNVWQPITQGAPFAGSTVVGLAAGPGGGVLVALRNGRLYVVRDGTAVRWPSAATRGLTGVQLNGLLRLRDGRYVLGTVNEGVYLLRPSGQVSAHLGQDEGLGVTTPSDLFEDQAGNLWVALEDRIVHVDLASGLTTIGESLGTVYDLEVSGASLYIAAAEGLARYDIEPPTRDLELQLVARGQSPVWHVHETDGRMIVGDNQTTHQVSSGASPELRPIGALAGGWCWLSIDSANAIAGTYVGLEAFRRGPNGWYSRGSLDGYTGPVQRLVSGNSPGVYSLKHPQEGDLQVRVDLEELSVVVLGEAVQSPTSSASNQQVKLHKPGRAGILEFGRGAITLYQGGDTVRYRVPVNLEYPSAVALADGRVAIGLESGLALLPGRDEASANLTVGTSAFAKTTDRSTDVYFSRAAYTSSTRWRVALEGIDTAFTEWSSSGAYTFPQLRHGDYVLRWQSDAGEEGQLSWTIAPRWYQTTAAWIVYVLLGLLALLATRVYYRRRLAVQRRLAIVERERQLQAERLRTRAAALEAEVEKSRRAADLASAEAQHRNRELARSTVALAKQNDTLLQVREALAPLPKTGEVGKARRQLARLVAAQLDREEDWGVFHEHFDVVHAGFLARLKESHPQLTSGDLRLASLLRMNLPSKEIAPLLHISVRGIENKRYRLRKKLGLGAEVNLADWILSY